jgi:hypothetical protein
VRFITAGPITKLFAWGGEDSGEFSGGREGEVGNLSKMGSIREHRATPEIPTFRKFQEFICTRDEKESNELKTLQLGDRNPLRMVFSSEFSERTP